MHTEHFHQSPGIVRNPQSKEMITSIVTLSEKEFNCHMLFQCTIFAGVRDDASCSQKEVFRKNVLEKKYGTLFTVYL
jgi:hypothetical protein